MANCKKCRVCAVKTRTEVARILAAAPKTIEEAAKVVCSRPHSHVSDQWPYRVGGLESAISNAVVHLLGFCSERCAEDHAAKARRREG